MKHSKLGFGVVGSLDIDLIRQIARRAEELGYDTLWVNDTPGGDSLARLHAAAEVTSRIGLATGVISVDRIPATTIIERTRGLDLPLDRLKLGIGGSAPPSPLTRVSEAIDVLHDGLPVPVLVGSLGPKMRRLGAEHGDGLLFNWLPPRFAKETTLELREWAAAAGKHDPIAATYVRTAIGRESRQALEEEASRYSRIPSYAANFKRLGISAMDPVAYAEEDGEIAGLLGAYDGAVDHVVLRAITPSNDVAGYERLLAAGAPLTRE